MEDESVEGGGVEGQRCNMLVSVVSSWDEGALMVTKKLCLIGASLAKQGFTSTQTNAR